MNHLLPQGPYSVEKDDGWRTLLTTAPSDRYYRNPGMGLIGYTWEENGPSLAVRNGKLQLEQFVERMASSPYVDALYIRCDWRDVQRAPGKLSLSPVWRLTLDAARKYKLPVGFRVQLSSPNFQPKQLAAPDFIQERVPFVKIGRKPNLEFDYREPQYDHPAFLTAFQELNDLLAAEFDGDPTIEYMDLMMYGFWGEGHSSGLPHPFADDITAERTMTRMAEMQLEAWKRTQLVVNMQTDISRVGNVRVQEMAISEGHWARVDSIIVEEPWGIEQLASRPQATGLIVEDGTHRHYDSSRIPVLPSGMNALEDAMKHAADVGGQYWALWTEEDQFAAFDEANPAAIPALRRRLGYRVRPAWIWQRIRGEGDELVVAVANDGAGGIPGRLRIVAESLDGRYREGGLLAPGEPAGGRVKLVSFLLPPEMSGQVIALRAELELRPGLARPVRWCCEPVSAEDGGLHVKLHRHDEPGWRKNI
ncbi:hypothetical protein [Paenibacillus koleovorans]|uniref:hypothetical protein n=1 Tax=Paenibacillus koleovorans TaxID=121608 RepID=UPI000FD7AFA7|nr:hypothetical protein [Paenibacillus koleovorans]